MRSRSTAAGHPLETATARHSTAQAHPRRLSACLTAQVAPIFSTNAADRTDCYPLIAFGSQNCCVYCDSFPEEDGRYKLTQWFDSTDLLSCEFCDKQGGVCSQAKDDAGKLVSCAA